MYLVLTSWNPSMKRIHLVVDCCLFRSYSTSNCSVLLNYRYLNLTIICSIVLDFQSSGVVYFLWCWLHLHIILNCLKAQAWRILFNSGLLDMNWCHLCTGLIIFFCNLSDIYWCSDIIWNPTFLIYVIVLKISTIK